MPNIRPITDLRKTAEMSDLCHEKHEPIFITKMGYGDMVLMSTEVYEDLLEAANLDSDIAEAEAEYERGGQLHDARKALESIRRKHFG